MCVCLCVGVCAGVCERGQVPQTQLLLPALCAAPMSLSRLLYHFCAHRLRKCCHVQQPVPAPPCMCQSQVPGPFWPLGQDQLSQRSLWDYATVALHGLIWAHRLAGPTSHSPPFSRSLFLVNYLCTNYRPRGCFQGTHTRHETTLHPTFFLWRYLLWLLFF